MGEGILANFFGFATFSNCFTLDWLKKTLNGNFFPKTWLRLAPNDQFWSFCRFSHLFPQNDAQIDLEWPISLIHNFSHLLPPECLIFGKISKIIIPGEGGTLANFLSFSTYLNHFTLEWLKMTLNGKFCQKSDLDWLQNANFHHFAGLSIFSPKMRLRLTWNGQFHPIHNFSHLLPPKCLIFGEISKIFIPLGGISANFLSVSTFLNHFTLKWLKMTYNGKFCQKSGLDWLKMTNFGLQVFHLFSQNEALIDSYWPISPNSQLSPSFATKVSHFWRNFQKNFFVVGEGILAIFFCFATFSNCFTLDWLKKTLNGNFFPKKWLRLAPNDQFWSFCRFFHLFPQNEAQIDLEWPISPDSQLKNDPQWLIFPLKWLILAQNV